MSVSFRIDCLQFLSPSGELNETAGAIARDANLLEGFYRAMMRARIFDGKAIALQRTGGVELAANALIALVGGATPRFVLGTLFVVTAALGMFISNTATAVLMAPVALAIARDLGASPYPFAMTVALAASAAFMTPISSPVNTLVVGPGNYAFGDFVRVGVPFTLIVLAVTVVLVPWLLPLR